jgi:hypothetical protein
MTDETPTDTAIFIVYDIAFNTQRDKEDPECKRAVWSADDVRRFHTAARRAVFSAGRASVTPSGKTITEQFEAYCRGQGIHTYSDLLQMIEDIADEPDFRPSREASSEPESEVIPWGPATTA